MSQNDADGHEPALTDNDDHDDHREREETTMRATPEATVEQPLAEAMRQGVRQTREPDERMAAWAEKLARRLRQAQEVAPTITMSAEEWIPGAVAALWRFWDEAVAQATAALVQAGLPERILTMRTDYEYRLGLEGAEGDARYIRIFAGLRAVNGHASGGAQISTSSTRATIHLVPSVEGGRLRWLVPATGSAFTARIVDDLLLSVFGNDPAATHRLGPYFSIEESV